MLLFLRNKESFMKRKICYIFIIFSLIFNISDYFIAMRTSYNRYLDGEYYFRYKATTQSHDSDTWWTTAEAQNADYSDTKVMLIHSSGHTCYVYKPHDGVCSLVYGKDKVVENFPLSNLVIEEEDKDYFYGTKKYTYEEYINKLNALTDEQLKGIRVSDPAMRNYQKIKMFMFILIGMDAFMGMVLFFLYRAELDGSIDLLLMIGAFYSIAFDVITFFAYGFLR